MGDSRNEKGYEMAPQSDPDPEKGGADGEIAQSEWTGLGKEELLRVADTPGWNWARNILLILFWVGWVAMLVAAIIIVVRVPRCPEVEWWEKSVFYQAYPRSLQDSDGDGVGDLKGVEQKLDYLADIGAGVVYLNSIYRERNVSSPDGGSVNVGYDIVDFKNVDESLGSLEDFEALMAAATAKGIKVVLEFVPNHSSDEHPWFENSRSGQDSEYADFYIWADGGGQSSPPNDWKNAYGESAWNWNADRQQFYYAYFGPKLPDFNYNNKSLCEEIENILSFWLTEYLVDGFVFSHVDYLFEPPITTVADGVRRRRQAGTTGAGGETPGTTPAAEPEPATSGLPSKEMPPQYDFVGGNSETQKQLFGLLESWRKLFNDNSYLGKYRLMVTQSEGSIAEVAKLYGQNKTRLADYPLDTGFLDTFDSALSGSALAMRVENWMKAKENLNNQNRWNTWMLGCHDRSRIAERAGADYVNALNFMLLTLPGTPFVYFGDEIGMMNVDGATEAQDRVPEFYPSEPSRDPFRTPMPWNDATNAGFTWDNATAYLPLPADAAENNVEAQLEEDFSNLNILKELAMLHTEPSIVAGRYEKIVADDNVFAYMRAFGEWPRYLVVVNVGADATHNLYDLGSGSKVPMEGRVVLSTSGEARSGKMKKNGKRKGTKESLNNIKTMKGEALIIKL